MKLIILIVTLLFLQVFCQAQITDSILAKKLTINGFCLCQTTLNSLKRSNPDLKKVELEEMGFSPRCANQDSRYQDSRYIAGEGYYTDKQPGILFQKSLEQDYIGKIRLTKQFKGKLPDGNYIDMSQFLLKDLLKLYPQFSDKCTSSDCSDYWSFSNDTLSFYVKIDKSKQPKYPFDEEYYANKPIEAIELLISCYSIRDYIPNYNLQEIDREPIYFIDSIRVNKIVLDNYNFLNIATVTNYKDTEVIKILGSEAKYGLVYVETKTFAKQRYWRYFKSKSEEYAALVPTPENDSVVQYILNKKILKDNYEKDLVIINDKVFKGIEIISKAQLIKDYGITDKKYGVAIQTSNSGQ